MALAQTLQAWVQMAISLLGLVSERDFFTSALAAHQLACFHVVFVFDLLATGFVCAFDFITAIVNFDFLHLYASGRGFLCHDGDRQALFHWVVWAFDACVSRAGNHRGANKANQGNAFHGLSLCCLKSLHSIRLET